MNLNGIPCGGYRIIDSDSTEFSLISDVETVSSLKGDLKLTKDDNVTLIASFIDQVICSIFNGESSVTVVTKRDIPKSVEKTIKNLENNLSVLSGNVTGLSNKYGNIQNQVTQMDVAVPYIIMRSKLTDKEALDCISLYPEWQIGFDYKQDWIIRHNDDLYRIGQDHTSQEQWVPGADGTTALYSKIVISEDGYETWQEYDGVSGTYALDQIVRDPNDEKLYKSKIDNNVWGPPSEQPDYWELYEA